MGPVPAGQLAAARDAESVIAGDGAQWADADDPCVASFVDYLKALTTATVREQAEVRHRWPILSIAHEIARQSDQEISVQCGLPPEVIARYEELFFNVRCSLEAEGWIWSTVLGGGLCRGFRDDEVAGFGGTFGYYDDLGVSLHLALMNVVWTVLHASRVAKAPPKGARRPLRGPWASDRQDCLPSQTASSGPPRSRGRILPSLTMAVLDQSHCQAIESWRRGSPWWRSGHSQPPRHFWSGSP